MEKARTTQNVWVYIKNLKLNVKVKKINRKNEISQNNWVNIKILNWTEK